MSIEGFSRKPKSEDAEEEDENFKPSRRGFLKGAAALAASTAFTPVERALGSDLPELEQLTTPEARERNVEKIYAYAKWIKDNEVALANAHSKAEIEEIIYAKLPALEEHVLEGTELDVKEFLSARGWLAQAISLAKVTRDAKTNEVLYETKSFANTFTVNGHVLSNGHVLGSVAGCVGSKYRLDIAGCPLDNEVVVPPQDRPKRQRARLSWNPANAKESLTGKIVFVPTVRFNSQNEPYEELVPAVLIPITPNFLHSEENSDAFFNKKDSEAQGHNLLFSYMAVVAPTNIDGDGIRTGEDIRGMSGSPLVTHEDCLKGQKNVSGMVWGSFTADYMVANQSHAIMLAFGPDVIGYYLDQVDANFDSTLDQIDRQTLTLKIQEALNVWRSHFDLDEITVDGLFGKETQEAIAVFQRAVFGRKAAGKVYREGLPDEATWEKLFPGEPFIDYNTLQE